MRRVLLSVMVMVGLSAGVVFTQGAHSAHWYNQDAAPSGGRFSVLLHQPNGAESVVAVTREKGIETTIAGIGVDLTYQRKILNCDPSGCFPPNIILGIDQNLNGRYDADDFQWQWSLVDETPLVADPSHLHGDTFLQCEAAGPVATPDTTWVLIDAYATYNCYHPNTAGTNYDLDYFPLSLYQLGLGAPDVTPFSNVRALKVLAGGSGSWMAYDALVDKVTLANGLRIDEPNNSRSHFEVDTR